MEEELQELLRIRSQVRKGGFSQRELDGYIFRKTGNRASDEASLNRLIADASTPVTAEEAAGFTDEAPGLVPGIAQNLLNAPAFGQLDKIVGFFGGKERGEAVKQNQERFAEESPTADIASKIAGLVGLGGATAIATRGLPALVRGAALIGEGGASAAGAAEPGERIPAALKGAGISALTLGVPALGSMVTRAARSGPRRLESVAKRVLRRRQIDPGKVADDLPGLRKTRGKKPTSLNDITGFEGTVKQMDKAIKRFETVDEAFDAEFFSRMPEVIQTAWLTLVQPQLALARASGAFSGATIRSLDKTAKIKAMRQLRAIINDDTPGVAEKFMRTLAQGKLPGDLPTSVNALFGGASVGAGGASQDPEKFMSLAPFLIPQRDTSGFQGSRR